MHTLLKTILPAVLMLSLFSGCKSDKSASPCIEAEVLSPNCPPPGAYGYPIRIISKTDLKTGVWVGSDGATLQNVVSAFYIPLEYQVKGKKIYVNARMATPKESGAFGVRTANCIEPPMVIIRSISDSGCPPASDN
jgi:hypothetical protein